MSDPYADIGVEASSTPSTSLSPTVLTAQPLGVVPPTRKNYNRKVVTPAEKKVQGTLSLRDPDSDKFTQVPLQEGGLTSFIEAMDEATGISGYGEMEFQGGALGGFGSQGFIPPGTSAGTIQTLQGAGPRVPTEAFAQALSPEEQMQFFEGALPPEPEDVERFQWEAATDEERTERQIALAGQAPPETGIPEFMPGVEPKPEFSAEGGLTPLDSTHAFMAALEAGSRPFDAFAEAAFRTGKAGLLENEWDNSVVDLIMNPNKFVDAETEYIKAFRERPWWAQMLLSVIDPTILFGPLGKGSRVASALIRAVSPDDLARIMAKRGVAPFANYRLVASGSTDEFVQNMLNQPGVRRVGADDIDWILQEEFGQYLDDIPSPYDLPEGSALRQEVLAPTPQRRQYPGGVDVERSWQAPWVATATDLAYKEGVPVEGPVAAWPRVQNPADLDYRYIDYALQPGERQVIIVSSDFPQGRRITVAASQAANDAVEEAMGKTSDAFVILEGTASRKEVLQAADNIAVSEPSLLAAARAEGQHLGFIPGRHVIKNEAAFAAEELTEEQLDNLRREFVEQLPREIETLVDEGVDIPIAGAVPEGVDVPRGVAESKPRYRKATPEFDSPVDKALYMKSASFLRWAMDVTGMTRTEALAAKAHLKRIMKGLYDGSESFHVPAQYEASRTARAAPTPTPTPVRRMVDSGGPLASPISPESAISERLQRPRFVEAASVASAGPRVVPVAPPRADPTLFGDIDLFHIVDTASETGEVVAAIEIRKPGKDGAAQIQAFYPTVEGGGAGMFGTDGIKKIVQQLGDLYPDLNNLHFGAIPARVDGFAEYATGGAVEDMARRLNATPIADDAAEQLDQAFPRASSLDSEYSELMDSGWAIWGIPEGINGGSDSLGARLTRMYDPGHGGAGTPIDHMIVGGEMFPKDPSKLIYNMYDWDYYNDLFDSPGKLTEQALRIPGIGRVVREVGGMWNRAQFDRDNPVAWLGHRVEIWKKFEKARMQVNIDAWWAGAKDELGFKEIYERQIIDWAKGEQGTWRATKVSGYDPTKVASNSLHGTLDDILEDLAKARADAAYAASPDRAYKLTTQQELFLQQGMDLQDDMFRRAADEGIDVGEMAEGYWQRIIIRGPKDDPNAFAKYWRNVAEAPRGATVRQTYRYERAFETMQEAVEAGFVYDTNPLARLGARLEAGIDSIAHSRAMGEIAVMEGADGRPLLSQHDRLLLKKPDGKFWFANGPRVWETFDESKRIYAAAKRAHLAEPDSVELLDDFRAAEAKMNTAKRQVEAQAGAGFYDAVLNGKIGDASLIADIKKYIDIPEIQNSRLATRPMDSPEARFVKEVSQMARSLMTNVDLAAAGIQGNILIFRDFNSWVTAVAVSLEAFIRKPEAYLARNRAILEEGMSVGAIIRPTEFLFGSTGLSSLPTRIPLAGRAFTAFSRSFEYFIMVGQTELYKVTKAKLTNRPLMSTTKRTGMSLDRQIIGDVPINQAGARTDMIDVGKAIRRELGTEDYAILGIRPTQQTFEAFTLFAARFFRANIGLIGMAIQPRRSIGSWEARRALAQMVAGATSLTVGAHYHQTGRPPNLTDPYAPDWFQVPVGKTYFNFFGPLYPYFKTMARISLELGRGDPGAATTQAARFLRSKESLPLRGINLTAELMVNGESTTFEGEAIDKSWKGVARGAAEFGAPLAPTSIAEAVADGRHEAIVTEVFGLTGRASPYSQMDILFQQYINDPNHPMAMARKRHDRELGGSYRDASPAEKDYMKIWHEDLYEREIQAGSGDYGDARREWDIAKSDAIKMEISHGERLHNPSHKDGMIGGAEFRKKFAGIQQTYWKSIEDTNARIGLFQEEQDIDDIDNEYDKAMYEWTQIYETSKNPRTNEIDWEQVEDKKQAFEDKTPEYMLQYIHDNTGLGHSKIGRELVHDRRELRPYWDKKNQIIDDLPPWQRQLHEDWSDMPEEQQRQVRDSRYQEINTKVNRLLSQWLYREEKSGNTQAGYWEEKLVRWGYVTDPVTQRGVDKRLELNKTMGIHGQVTTPRTVSSVTAAPSATPTSGDPYADITIPAR